MLLSGALERLKKDARTVCVDFLFKAAAQRNVSWPNAGPVSRGIHPFLEAKMKISYKNNHHHGSSNISILFCMFLMF